MNLNPSAFPHPVMHPDSEDVEYNYSFRLSVEPLTDRYTLHCKVFTENKTLQALLSAGMAKAFVHVESLGGFFREIYPVIASGEDNEITISADRLNGKVEVRSFICADKDIGTYRNDKQHEDFGAQEFAVQARDYLAVGPLDEFIAEKDYDPLKTMSSFIKIVKGTASIDQPISLEYAGDKVKIIFPEKLYAKYWELRELAGHKSTVSALVILPVLVQLVAEMRNKGSEFQDNAWCLGLKRRFEKLGVDWQKTTESNYQLAQRLFEMPIKRVGDELTALRNQMI